MDFTLGTLLGFMAIGLAVIPGGYASSKAVGMVGRAGAGVITEDPDKFGPVLILQALPGTQGVYGFLTGLMIMVKMGVLGGSIQALTTNQGIMFILAAVPIAALGWLSAIFQGQVAASGVNIVAKRPEEMGKAVILAAMVETYAVLALLASLLMVLSINV
ncbi:MAG: V-type ATP synthase subunit K [Bacillota bacterium]|jgi:V/A-type H+-transporting ATPase subunit K|nr:V-type ATP synthase subunit K [Bacillota bacterium]NLH87767.1 V-type ATP synthase subunit K [Bacillota bacterium]HAN86392.1 V-type ATP synthase subunit K [Bacillota bacterium]